MEINIRETGTFVRKSHKYFIHLNKIRKIKQLINEKLPIHTRGAIHSIYLDNSSFTHYRDRLLKLNYATVFRFRYYGSNPNHVYIEKKVKRGDEFMSSSVKRRVKVSDKEALRFLNATQNGKLINLHLKNKNDSEFISEISKTILSEAQQLVSRTEAYRTSFEDVSNTNYRITIDENVWFYKEKWKNGWNWESYSPKESFSMPYGILEVKDRGVGLDYILKELELDKSISKLDIIPLDRFSKYCTSIAMFYDTPFEQPTWMQPLLKASSGENVPGAIFKRNRGVAKRSIDPKLILSNERTLLNWLQNAQFLGMLSIILFPNTSFYFVAGCASILALNGTFLYAFRLVRIRCLRPIDNGTLIIPFVTGLLCAVIFPLILTSRDLINQINF